MEQQRCILYGSTLPPMVFRSVNWFVCYHDGRIGCSVHYPEYQDFKEVDQTSLRTFACLLASSDTFHGVREGTVIAALLVGFIGRVFIKKHQAEKSAAFSFLSRMDFV